MGFGPQWPRGTGRGQTRNMARAPMRNNRNLVRTGVLLLLGVIAAIAARFTPTTVQGTIEGRPRLVDGDSFFLGRTEVRMQGIDAPEGRQICTRDGREWRCGEASRRTLERFLGGRPIRCEIHSTDQHGRGLATCFNASGDNLNARMVAEGFAVAFGAYKSEEAVAKSAGLGIWGSQFERPQDLRRRMNGSS